MNAGEGFDHGEGSQNQQDADGGVTDGFGRKVPLDPLAHAGANGGGQNALGDHGGHRADPDHQGHAEFRGQSGSGDLADVSPFREEDRCEGDHERAGGGMLHFANLPSVRLAPQHHGYREEVDRGDGSYQRAEGRVEMALPTRTATAILAMNARVIPMTMWRRAVTGGQNAGGVEQFVPDDLGYEYGAVGGEQNREHCAESYFLGGWTAHTHQTIEFVHEPVTLENIVIGRRVLKVVVDDAVAVDDKELWLAEAAFQHI